MAGTRSGHQGVRAYTKRARQEGWVRLRVWPPPGQAPTLNRGEEEMGLLTESVAVHRNHPDLAEFKELVHRHFRRRVNELRKK